MRRVRRVVAGRRSGTLATLALAAVGLGVAMHGLGSTRLADFDEAINADIVRGMATGHGWLVPFFNGTVHLRRPPLYFWLAAGVAVLLRQNSAFAYRLPSAVAGVALVVAVAVVARRHYGLRRSGWIAGLSLLSMPYFVLLSRAAMLDVLAAALTTATILAGSAWLRGGGRGRLAALTGVGLGLTALEFSAMAVLPLAVLVVDGIWLGLSHRREWRGSDLLWIVVPALAIGLWWPILMSVWYPHTFWSQYLFQNVISRVAGQVEQSTRPIYYYLPLLAGGIGAWSPLLAVAIVGSGRRAWRAPDSLERLAFIWIVVAVVGFSAVGTKLPWYIIPVYPAGALLIAAYLGRWLDHEPSDSVPGPTRSEMWLLVLAAGFGVGMGLWPDLRPVPAIGLTGIVGLAALVVLSRPGRSWGGAIWRRRWGLTLPRTTAAVLCVAAITLVAVGRQAVFPTTISAPGLAQALQPEPYPASEAAIALAAAHDTRVPLALLVGADPTMVYYSSRNHVEILSSLAEASEARGVWLITVASRVPDLRRAAPSLRILSSSGSLVLISMPGSPRHLYPSPGRS